MSRYIDANKLYIAAMDTEFYDAADEDVVLELINQQPTAEVQEVKHGRWEVKRCEGGIFDGSYHNECSVCGYKRFLDNDEIKYKTKYKFCPKCGAKMDKGEQ